jgi:hypothetical protein
MRFGLGMNSDHTLEEVGQQLSVTRELRAASTSCCGHPSAEAALAILSITCLQFFSLVCAISLRQVDIALRAAFTASRASLVSPGTDIGWKLRGSTSRKLTGIDDLHSLIGFPTNPVFGIFGTDYDDKAT